MRCVGHAYAPLRPIRISAFAIGALTGALIRRVVPAIVTTLAVCVAFVFATGGYA